MPGVGAFLAHRVPAHYNAAENIFMPPHRSLAFNPQVTIDDALLLSEYMADGLLSYEEANECLTNDIDSLRSQLSTSGIVCFGELGTFTMDIEGKIAFAPNENSIDDPYNYGFEPLFITPLSNLKKKDIVIKRSSIGRYVSIAAAIIVAVFVLAPFGNRIYDNGIQLSVAGFTPVESASKPTVTVQETVFDIAPVEESATAHIFTDVSGTEPVAESVEEPIADVVTTPAVVEESAEMTTETPKQYSIIVASTPNPQNAQLAITELSRKMQADYKVVEGDRRFRIAIENYDNEAEANEALTRVKATFSDAWVYIH